MRVITLRPYRPDDAPALLALFRDTIRRINSRDYSPEQVAAWASEDIDTERWFGRFTGRFVPVAEEAGCPVGFAELEPDGHIDRVYVSADHQRRGIGRQLLDAIVAEARRVGLARLFTEASITARPFFEAHGFAVLAPQVVTCRGVEFVNYRMGPGARRANMIPIWITVNQYSAEVLGRAAKVVSCENCSTEYVYMLERVSTGSGYSTGILPLPAPDDDAKARAETNAREGLKALLDEEFDPVPCPVCGHYQKHMFPKLQAPPDNRQSVLMLAAILIGFAAGIAAVKYSLRFLRAPDNGGLVEMTVFWVIALAMVVVGVGLSILDKRRIRRFDPNTEADRSARIALGRSRAISKVEFDAIQRERAGESGVEGA